MKEQWEIMIQKEEIIYFLIFLSIFLRFKRQFAVSQGILAIQLIPNKGYSEM